MIMQMEMKRVFFCLAVLAAMVLAVSACDPYYSLEEERQIVNHSSCRVAATFDMRSVQFDLAPGESYEYKVYLSIHKSDMPDGSRTGKTIGPRELIVDGVQYTLDPNLEVKGGFFDLVGWDVKTYADKIVSIFEFTDENLAEMLEKASKSDSTE